MKNIDKIKELALQKLMQREQIIKKGDQSKIIGKRISTNTKI